MFWVCIFIYEPTHCCHSQLQFKKNPQNKINCSLVSNNVHALMFLLKGRFDLASNKRIVAKFINWVGLITELSMSKSNTHLLSPNVWVGNHFKPFYSKVCGFKACLCSLNIKSCEVFINFLNPPKHTYTLFYIYIFFCLKRNMPLD